MMNGKVRRSRPMRKYFRFRSVYNYGSAPLLVLELTPAIDEAFDVAVDIAVDDALRADWQ